MDGGEESRLEKREIRFCGEYVRLDILVFVERWR